MRFVRMYVEQMEYVMLSWARFERRGSSPCFLFLEGSACAGIGGRSVPRKLCRFVFSEHDRLIGFIYIRLWSTFFVVLRLWNTIPVAVRGVD